MKRFGYILLGLCLPPVAVFIRAGLTWHLALNVFLCFAFFVPAMLHAVWFVTRADGDDTRARPMATKANNPVRDSQRQEPSF